MAHFGLAQTVRPGLKSLSLSTLTWNRVGQSGQDYSYTESFMGELELYADEWGEKVLFDHDIGNAYHRM